MRAVHGLLIALSVAACSSAAAPPPVAVPAAATPPRQSICTSAAEAMVERGAAPAAAPYADCAATLDAHCASASGGRGASCTFWLDTSATRTARAAAPHACCY
jgi:hypothetical protein